MRYRDLLGKRRAPRPVSEDEFLPVLTPPMTYARIRSEAMLVIESSDAPPTVRGMACVIIALLNERRRRG